MDSINKKALKAGTWYTICTFILKGLSFITMPLFTRILSVSDIGLYSNLASWITILGGIVTLDLFTSINLAHYQYDDIYKYMSTITISGSIITLIFYISAIIFSEKVILFLGISESMLHIMFIYFLVNPAVLILHAKFRIYLQYKKTIITSLLPALFSVIVSILFVTLASEKNKLQARITGYYGVWIIFALAIYIFILLKGKYFKFKYVKFALSVSVPLMIHTLANAVLSSSDRVMIQKICGSEYTAFYSIAYSCALVVSILWSAVNQAWSPWCFEMMHHGKEKIIGRAAKPILLLFSIGVLFLIMIAPELLYILGGKKYMQAIYVVPPVMLGYIAQMLYTLYVNIEYYNKKQKQIMVGTFIAAIINIVLNIIFIPIWGYVAAAYTTLIGYIVLLFVHYIFVRRMGMDYIYDIKFNLVLLIVVMICGIGFSLLYRFMLLRLLLVLILLIFVSFTIVLNMKELKTAIKNKDMVYLLQILHLMGKE